MATHVSRSLWDRILLPKMAEQIFGDQKHGVQAGGLLLVLMLVWRLFACRFAQVGV